MDDMVVFGSSKKKLHEIRSRIAEYLERNLGLKLKDNWQVYLFSYIDRNGNNIGRDLDFMGFRFFRNRTTLRKSLLHKAGRKARKINRKPRQLQNTYEYRQMLSYVGWLTHTDTYNAYRLWIKPFVSLRRFRKAVSHEQKLNNKSKGEKRQCGNMLNILANLVS